MADAIIHPFSFNENLNKAVYAAIHLLEISQLQICETTFALKSDSKDGGGTTSWNVFHDLNILVLLMDLNNHMKLIGELQRFIKGFVQLKGNNIHVASNRHSYHIKSTNTALNYKCKRKS